MRAAETDQIIMVYQVFPYHTPGKKGRSFVSLKACNQVVQFICRHLVQAVIFCEVVLWQPLCHIPHVGCVEVQVILPIVEHLLQKTNNTCWMNHTNVLECQLSGFIENVTFRRVNLFPSSSREGRWGRYFVGPASALSYGADKAGSLSLLPCLTL